MPLEHMVDGVAAASIPSTFIIDDRSQAGQNSSDLLA
jgi:hypothetical protein